jgi:hypothetical protein
MLVPYSSYLGSACYFRILVFLSFLINSILVFQKSKYMNTICESYCIFFIIPVYCLTALSLLKVWHFMLQRDKFFKI